MPDDFADLLARNESYAQSFDRGGFDGVAHAGVAMVTCMDSRIEPLQVVGLQLGDAKILRTPGAHVDHEALVGCILSVHLLGVDRILVVAHTRCAMASGTDAELTERLSQAVGVPVGDLGIGADPDQEGRLAADVARLRDHPLIRGSAVVGGFLYDVDTGRLQQRV